MPNAMTPVDPVAAFLAGLLLGVALLSLLRDLDRRVWAQERAALLERLVPGLTLPDAPPPPKRRPMTDAREREIEAAGRARGGGL